MKFLRAIAGALADEADRLSLAEREACHRDQVWAERDHLAAKLNADRRAAFEARKDLLRLASQPYALSYLPRAGSVSSLRIVRNLSASAFGITMERN